MNEKIGGDDQARGYREFPPTSRSVPGRVIAPKRKLRSRPARIRESRLLSWPQTNRQEPSEQRPAGNREREDKSENWRRHSQSWIRPARPDGSCRRAANHRREARSENDS